MLIIGSGGIFLTEVKTWNGSFAAYRDNWKRREGVNWVPLSNSPTSQSAYHQKVFQRWPEWQMPRLPKHCFNAPVVFPVAKWIGAKECCVTVCHGMRAFADLLLQSPECLSTNQILTLSRMVERCELTHLSH